MKFKNVKRLRQYGVDQKTIQAEDENGNLMFIAASDDNNEYREIKKQEREGNIVIKERDVDTVRQ